MSDSDRRDSEVQGAEVHQSEVHQGGVHPSGAHRGEKQRGEVRRGEAQRGEVRRGEAQRGEVRRGEAQRGEAGGRTWVVLVGDVVTARRFTDEAALLRGLAAALDDVDGHAPAEAGLRLAVRDEFHGVYADVGVAAEAALRLRLATDDLVLPTVDGIDEPVELRIGLGIGTIDDGAAHPTGSAWRHARDARAAAQALPVKRTWPPSMRSACRADDPMVERTLQALLLLQDQLLARLDARDRRALTGTLDGERQVDIAAALGVTQPAIARRLRDRGALAIHRALLTLRGDPDGR